ncbi:MAG: hypothetical protein Tsb002_19720 [Wenzhouxiangellaceae bacterium]
MPWKKGRGKLGVFDPLLGSWSAVVTDSQRPHRCTRTFRRVLNAKYIQADVHWQFEDDKDYAELCLFGPHEKSLAFWSFASDCKHAHGTLDSASDIHPQAIVFIAQMPAGLARQIYWPDDGDGFYWAVEAHNKSGWKRFIEHHYQAYAPAAES